MAEATRYFVFARREYSEPLTQVGTLEAPAGRSVRDATAQQYGDHWLELVAIPESQLTWAIRED